jgi:hypothetical protein
MSGAAQEVSGREAPRRKVWTSLGNRLKADTIFLDDICMIAIREGLDVGVRDASYKEVGVVSLEQAQQRLSSEELDRRVLDQRLEIHRASMEIQRLEGIRAQLYGESQKGENTTGFS